MKSLHFLKSFLKLSFIYIFIFELIFQLLIFFDFKFIKIADLFYNGYCDQKYWNFNNKKAAFKTKTKYHPILSFVKNDIVIPEKILDHKIVNESSIMNNNIALYGSSFMNHNEFKSHLSKRENINFINYALDSYGLDQIYLSYKLTAHLNQNSTIVIGFLLEDLDRSIFHKREYQKALFVKKKKSFELKNIPIKQNNTDSKSIDFYLYKFLKNFYNLTINNFDPRTDECHMDLKKDLFSFYVDNISSISSKYNQKVIFITFNLKKDLIKEPTWRYSVIKNYINTNNIIHIDSYKLLKDKSSSNEDKINSYFGADKHNNEESFGYIVEELFKSL